MTPWCHAYTLLLGCLTSLLSTLPKIIKKKKKILSSSTSFLLFIGTLLLLILIVVPMQAKHSEIFFLTLLGSSLPLSLSFVSWGIFSLFSSPQTYLMWQRLGKGSQIDEEVKIFNLLACSGSFPRSWVLHGSYMWVIRAPCF